MSSSSAKRLATGPLATDYRTQPPKERARIRCRRDATVLNAVNKYSFLLVALFALIAVPFANSAARTTSPDVYVSAFVTLGKSKVTISPARAPSGTMLRLIVTNKAKQPQRFSFDFSLLSGGKHTGFNLVFQPGEHRIFLLELVNQQRMQYFSGSSYNAAGGSKRGIFIVGPECGQCDVG
jgi:hypothetical protein